MCYVFGAAAQNEVGEWMEKVGMMGMEIEVEIVMMEWGGLRWHVWKEWVGFR